MEDIIGYLCRAFQGRRELDITFCSENLLQERHFLGMHREKSENNIKLILRKYIVGV
jgi:hypothetical protein